MFGAEWFAPGARPEAEGSDPLIEGAEFPRRNGGGDDGGEDGENERGDGDGGELLSFVERAGGKLRTGEGGEETGGDADGKARAVET